MVSPAPSSVRRHDDQEGRAGSRLPRLIIARYNCLIKEHCRTAPRPFAVEQRIGVGGRGMAGVAPPLAGGAPNARVTTLVAEVLHTGGVPNARVTALVAEVLHGLEELTAGGMGRKTIVVVVAG
jgi:hypothetical protein